MYPTHDAIRWQHDKSVMSDVATPLSYLGYGPLSVGRLNAPTPPPDLRMDQELAGSMASGLVRECV